MYWFLIFFNNISKNVSNDCWILWRQIWGKIRRGKGIVSSTLHLEKTDKVRWYWKLLSVFSWDGTSDSTNIGALGNFQGEVKVIKYGSLISAITVKSFNKYKLWFKEKVKKKKHIVKRSKSFKVQDAKLFNGTQQGNGRKNRAQFLYLPSQILSSTITPKEEMVILHSKFLSTGDKVSIYCRCIFIQLVKLTY